MPNCLAFRTPHVRGFLMFDVPNAKYLTFNTLDASVLISTNIKAIYDKLLKHSLGFLPKATYSNSIQASGR